MLTFSYFASRMSFAKVRNVLVYSLARPFTEENGTILTIVTTFDSATYIMYTG